MQNNSGILLNRLISLKDDLIQIIKFAIEVAKSEKKSNRTSNYNMTVDIKDNLHEPLKSFAEENEIYYCRSNLSQYLIIDNQKVKIKFHNSLPKVKRDIIEKSESNQMKLPLDCLKEDTEPKDSEWEIGIKTSTERTVLQIVRLADFNNNFVKTIYNHKTEVLEFPISENNLSSDQENKHNFRLKSSLIQAKEIEKDKEERKEENGI